MQARVFVDDFLAGRPSQACWCEARDKKERICLLPAHKQFSNSISVCDSCLHSQKCRLYEFILAGIALPASQVARHAWLDSRQSSVPVFLDAFPKSEEMLF